MKKWIIVIPILLLLLPSIAYGLSNEALDLCGDATKASNREELWEATVEIVNYTVTASDEDQTFLSKCTESILAPMWDCFDSTTILCQKVHSYNSDYWSKGSALSRDTLWDLVVDLITSWPGSSQELKSYFWDNIKIVIWLWPIIPAYG